MKRKRFHAADRDEWRDWLERHHASEPEIWLVYAKKHTGKPSVRYAEAVEEALCFGWIDTTVNRLDDGHYMQRFTPRTDVRKWSKLNRERFRRLVAEDRMADAGRAKLPADVPAPPRRLPTGAPVPTLDEFGLVEALRLLVARHCERARVRASFTATPADARAPAEIETACFRIVQEALSNVSRHARARHVEVTLMAQGDALEVTVRDDGVGFNVERLHTGLGLVGMGRARRIRGRPPRHRVGAGRRHHPARALPAPAGDVTSSMWIRLAPIDLAVGSIIAENPGGSAFGSDQKNRRSLTRCSRIKI